jgi:hypothetical protein
MWVFGARTLMQHAIADSQTPYVTPLTPVYFFLILLQERHLLLPSLQNMEDPMIRVFWM